MSGCDNRWPVPSRRGFMKGGLATGICSIVGRARADRAEDRLTVSLLHTTDLHGHILPTRSYGGEENVGGFARCATQIRAWREEIPHSLLVDAGDVYQGTQAGYSTQGSMMIRCFNHLGYDAWVLGNHEFDWGVDPVKNVISLSSMPVLSANAHVRGKPAGMLDDPGDPLVRVAPFIVREVGGIRIGVIGVTTTGMAAWFDERFYEGFDFVDPVEPVRRALNALSARGVHAAVLVGHMGLRREGDDFANRMETLGREFPELAVMVGGHTHRLIESSKAANVPYTQANYHGIHCGRVMLTFDRASKRLLNTTTELRKMDASVVPDPAILDLTAEDLRMAREVHATPVGVLEQAVSVKGSIGQPSDMERLIAASIREAMEKIKQPVDAVLHGLFVSNADFSEGEKVIADFWNVMPYENRVVTARLLPSEIAEIAQEVFTASSKRNFMGIVVQTEGRGRSMKVVDLRDEAGNALESSRRYTLAMNSYDAQSGGQLFPRLREIIRGAEAGMQLHEVQTRAAMIDYFTKRGRVRFPG